MPVKSVIVTELLKLFVKRGSDKDNFAIDLKGVQNSCGVWCVRVWFDVICKVWVKLQIAVLYIVDCGLYVST